MNLAYQSASDPECCILIVHQDEDFLCDAHLKRKRLNQKVQSDIEVGSIRQESLKRKRK